MPKMKIFLTRCSNKTLQLHGGVLFGLGPAIVSAIIYHAYNDSIYPIIIEGIRIAGRIVHHISYLVFLFRCIRVFRKCPYAFGAFLALGLSFTLVIQANKHGSWRKSYTDNRCHVAIGKHGRKLILIYLRINWNYFKCGKKYRSTTTRATDPRVAIIEVDE